MQPLWIIAHKEFRDGLRNRWFVAISLILALMAVGLAWFGAAASGQGGIASLPTTVVSLSSLSVFVIPLIALILAYDGLVGEEEGGTLLLLLTYPLARWQLLLGKLLGHCAIMAAATVVGLGGAAMLLAIGGGVAPLAELLPAFALLIVSAVVLGWIFIAFAYLISACVSNKSKAAGLALCVWFLFVLVFDLGLLGILVGSRGQVDEQLFPYLLLLNPTDIFRLLPISYFAQSAQEGGLISIARQADFSLGFLFSVLLLWWLLPLSGALLVFHKRRF